MKIDVVNSAVIIDDVDTGVKFIEGTKFQLVVDELKDKYSEWVEPRDTMMLITRQLRDKRINTQ